MRAVSNENKQKTTQKQQKQAGLIIQIYVLKRQH